MYYLAEDLNYMIKDLAIDRRERAQTMMNALGKFMQYLRKTI